MLNVIESGGCFLPLAEATPRQKREVSKMVMMRMVTTACRRAQRVERKFFVTNIETGERCDESCPSVTYLMIFLE